MVYSIRKQFRANSFLKKKRLVTGVGFLEKTDDKISTCIPFILSKKYMKLGTNVQNHKMVTKEQVP